MSSDKSYSFNDKSDCDDSDCVSSGTYSFHAFSLRFDDSVVSIRGLGSGVFVPTVVESKCGIFKFYMFELIRDKSKVVRLVKMSGKGFHQIIRTFNGKVADDSV